MTRRPAVAGTFYEGDASSLREQIEWCYAHAHGPGEVPRVSAGERSLIGLVSPHAGYMYSGPVAAHGFAYIARDGRPKSVVIIGPNHTGVGSGVSIMTSGEWFTPLGKVGIDRPLAEAIGKGSDLIDVDEVAHAHEHSLEVQLPFLQHLFGDRFGIVPICMMMQDEETSREVGGAIAKAVAKGDAVILASTDFTHYELQQSAAAKDRMAIDKILALDWRGLLRTVYDKDISMCGSGPVAAMLCAAVELGAKRAKLLKYATSGDTAGPMPQVVGYGSIAVIR
ncbi:MAG: AmmeMemoRadiSam system protein B [Candidatus Hodarchaeaceae archaeon]|nr:AmmeMemoRadiSam system protein B [Candidatus Hodarchaeaceae archaeon]